ncbi:hypothetical protein [Mucilaginibacter arboris]|uniref:Uncharacterized protein n=1 Tax=Mucilaginibacter arboris TaxID=2682090 RepID=A0A7K1SYU7_9SPHI|nr:hypothetical protein [Mucilaginibacter arboris]MVN22210.1 hypothetical protein [Mucilaginibacter arboris]
MKTSSKLFITAISIIIISMITYDFALRAEYKKGTYKSRLYGFEKTIAFNGFNTIDNRAANLISIQVEKGNEPGVWVKSVWKDRFRISRNGNALVIEVANKQSTRVSAYDNSITIVCPSLDKVTTAPYLGKSGMNLLHSRGTTTVVGFTLDRLSLEISKGVDLFLKRNKIADLQARVGDELSDNAKLTISSNNQINNAKITVPGKNGLEIENSVITQRNFTIADSATVTFSGKFLKLIGK